MTLLLQASFGDTDQLCEAVQQWNLEFRPLSLIRPQGEIGRVKQLFVEEMELSYARFSVVFDQFGAPPPDRVTFVVLEERLQRLWWRGHDVRNSEVMVFPKGSELRSLSGPDFEIFTLSLKEQQIETACERLGLSPLPPHRRRETFAMPLPALAKVRRSLRAAAGSRITSESISLPEVRDLLIRAWLGPGSKSRRRPSLRSRDRAMRQFMEALEHPDWIDLRVPELCELGAISERTLQYAFKERFGLTPAAFLKARRLMMARQRLQQVLPSEGRVGEIAADCGFGHQAQFAVDYRRSFGEAPLTTLKRLQS